MFCDGVLTYTLISVVLVISPSLAITFNKWFPVLVNVYKLLKVVVLLPFFREILSTKISNSAATVDSAVKVVVWLMLKTLFFIGRVRTTFKSPE